MKLIITLTLNPTIDGSASADVVQPLRKIRTTDERYHPGGGGINVARVLRSPRVYYHRGPNSVAPKILNACMPRSSPT